MGIDREMYIDGLREIVTVAILKGANVNPKSRLGKSFVMRVVEKILVLQEEALSQKADGEPLERS